MFETFILALIIFILLPIIRVVFTLWNAARKFKKQFRDYGAGTAGQSSQNYSQNRSSDNTDVSKKKIFDRNDGEYVEFEEIKVERTVSAETSQEEFHESQITDVKFEEIK